MSKSLTAPFTQSGLSIALHLFICSFVHSFFFLCFFFSCVLQWLQSPSSQTFEDHKEPMRVLTQSGLPLFVFLILLTCAQYCCPMHGTLRSLSVKVPHAYQSVYR